MKRTFFLVLILLTCVTPAHAEVHFDAIKIVLHSNNNQYPLKVLWAKTPSQRRMGLMHRTTLEPYAGMLFDFEGKQPIVMWMKNTPLSLDMVFYDKDGVVLGTALKAEPYSTKHIHAPKDTHYVLEMKTGSAKLLGITKGDRFSFVKE